LAKNAHFLAAIALRAPCTSLFPQLRRVEGEGKETIYHSNFLYIFVLLDFRPFMA
jgi:hypothetical protein